MANDPVCYGVVDENDGQFWSMFKEKEYYFCTAYCKKKFDKNPEKYAKVAGTISIEPGMPC